MPLGQGADPSGIHSISVPYQLAGRAFFKSGTSHVNAHLSVVLNFQKNAMSTRNGSYKPDFQLYFSLKR